MKKALGKRYSLGEEVANSVTHGIGAALSVAALSVLVTLAALQSDAWRVVSFSVYGATLILLYLASTLYHAIAHDRAKRILRLFDHAAIFLLIAGTYTPFTLVTFRGVWGWTIFGLIWGLALFGIVFTLFFFDRYPIVSVGFYVGMGWLVVVAIKPLVTSLATGGLIWIIAGGLFYTLGVVFYAWKKLPFHHAIWHLFVLGGSVCHFFCILFYVLPQSGMYR